EQAAGVVAMEVGVQEADIPAAARQDVTGPGPNPTAMFPFQGLDRAFGDFGSLVDRVHNGKVHGAPSRFQVEVLSSKEGPPHAGAALGNDVPRLFLRNATIEGTGNSHRIE